LASSRSISIFLGEPCGLQGGHGERRPRLAKEGADDPALRRPSFPPDEIPVRQLHRCLQPSLDLQEHPRAIGVLARQPHEQFDADAVEEGLDVEIRD
jgi:hypothetical protein